MPQSRPPKTSRRIAPEDQWYRALDDNEQFHQLLEHLGAVVTETDPDGKISYLSRTIEQLTGSPREEWLGRHQEYEVHPDDYKEILARRSEPIEEAGRRPLYHRSLKPDGTWRWIETIGATRFVAPDGGVYGVSISRDITEYRKMEDDLRETAERYTRVVQANDLLLIESAPDGSIVFASDNIERVMGYTLEEVQSHEPFSNIHPDDIGRLQEQFRVAVTTGKPTVLAPYRGRHRDGHWLWFQSTGVGYQQANGSQRFLNVTRDITDRVDAAREREELRQRMQQAQRLESLGLMAGGVAHDFNNLLTPILGDASLALRDLPEGSPMRPRIERIHKAAQRASDLTHQMLAYAGADDIVPEPLELSEFVESISRLLEATLPVGTSFVLDLASDLPDIYGDSGQLTQVVMNLITNASEALEPDGGTIDVRTGEFCFDAPPTSPFLRESLPAGRYVYVEVSDAGCGMEPETRDRIFDPFFTTKFTGRGLGLASVIGIMRAHSGTVEIETSPGQGTRFRVLFPVASGRTPVAAQEPGQAVKSGRAPAAVLVIDDDEGAREVAVDSLEREGLEVLVACDGPSGIELFTRRANEIALVILDRTMPMMSGEETFDRLKALRADVPVLLISGYGKKRAAEAFGDRGLAGFLRKPFLPEELSKRVHEILAER